MDQTIDNWAIDRINAAAAHDSGALGRGVIVAIFDDGIDCAHENLKPNLYGALDLCQETAFDAPACCGAPVSIDAVDGTDACTCADSGPYCGKHGTSMAGIAAARQKSASTLRGVAPMASILPVRVRKLDGLSVSEDEVSEAIQLAVRAGARVLSFSIGVSCVTPDCLLLVHAISKAAADGAIVIATAGNDSKSGFAAPARLDLPNVLPVIAILEDDRPYIGNNYDSKRSSLAAPGIGVAATQHGGGWHIVQPGTSAAAALVSGAAAAVLSHPAYQALTAVQLKCLLLEQARPVSTLKDYASDGCVLDLQFLRSSEAVKSACF